MNHQIKETIILPTLHLNVLIQQPFIEIELNSEAGLQSSTDMGAILQKIGRYPLTGNPEQLESLQVNWLIEVFDTVFKDYNTVLAHSPGEPEYCPATHTAPARLLFAHGYFASALHEISHWCIAQKQRRLLPDLGYWYAPDGRNAEQQKAFEQVEIKPQALEWLFTRACLQKFNVSIDNLNAPNNTQNDAFAQAVMLRTHALIRGEAPLPRDALRLLTVLYMAIRPEKPFKLKEFRLS